MLRAGVEGFGEFFFENCHLRIDEIVVATARFALIREHAQILSWVLLSLW